MARFGAEAVGAAGQGSPTSDRNRPPPRCFSWPRFWRAYFRPRLLGQAPCAGYGPSRPPAPTWRPTLHPAQRRAGPDLCRQQRFSVRRLGLSFRRLGLSVRRLGLSSRRLGLSVRRLGLSFRRQRSSFRQQGLSFRQMCSRLMFCRRRTPGGARYRRIAGTSAYGAHIRIPALCRQAPPAPHAFQRRTPSTASHTPASPPRPMVPRGLEVSSGCGDDIRVCEQRR